MSGGCVRRVSCECQEVGVSGRRHVSVRRWVCQVGVSGGCHASVRRWVCQEVSCECQVNVSGGGCVMSQVWVIHCSSMCFADVLLLQGCVSHC